MTKGRNCVPSSANEGIWFRHRGEPGDPEGRLRDVTSTREMLNAPFSAPVRPRTPPAPFKNREEPLYKNANPFTQHDNRNYFQDHGVYLGDGRGTRSLGRRLHPIDQRLHHTERIFLHHKSRNPTLHDYNPITATSFLPPGVTEQPTKRRFPHVYKAPQATSELSTNTTAWPNVAHRTPMHVLAVSQEPFPKHNSWKYSTHGIPRVYPSYNRKSSPRVDNILNRYGADFIPAPPERMATVD